MNSFKQAPGAWFQRLTSYLIELGFHDSISDTSLFILSPARLKMSILIYVDDILFFGSDSKAMDNIISQLNQEFSLKDLGNVYFFLGIKANYTLQVRLHLSQSR